MQIRPSLILLTTLLSLAACSTMSSVPPTKFIRKTDCRENDPIRGQQECGFGFSEVMTDENVYVVSFEGNSSTTLERTSDFAILRCAQIAKERVSLDIVFYITESDFVTSVDEQGEDGTPHPRTSVECEVLENVRRAGSLTVESVETDMRNKYPQEIL